MEARLAAGFAACAALAATLPVVGARGVPSIVRAGLAMALAPLAAAHAHAALHNSAPVVALEACAAALGGATMGLCAAIVAGAAASAGALLDVAITASPAGADRASGPNAGPFATLLPLGFSVALLSSGGLTMLLRSSVALFDKANSHVLDAGLVIALGRAAYDAVVAVALPVLAAYGVSSLIAAAAARAAPRINGMLLAPALSSPLAVAVALAAVPAMFAMLHRLAGLTVRIAQAT